MQELSCLNEQLVTFFLWLSFLLEVALNEISDMFKWFKKEAPTSVITKAEFTGVLQRMGVEDPFLQDLIFKVFDGTKTGCIRFPEFVFALSIITRGTPDEKLECTLRRVSCVVSSFMLRWLTLSV